MQKLLENKSVFQWGLLIFLAMLWASSAVAAGDWQRLYPWYPTNGYNDIYVVASNDVFAVGDNGLIRHYDGSDWSDMTSPVSVSLKSVWGRTANDVFAVGSGGTILHYNGTSWQKMHSPTQDDLYCVWGFSQVGSNVYAGGRNGNILLYSAGNWSYMDTPFSDGIWRYSIIYDIWGDSTSNLYAVGWGYDSGSGGGGLFDIFLSNTGSNDWINQASTYPGSAPLRPESVMGFAGGDVYIGGEEGLYRLQQGSWGNWEQILSGNSVPGWSRKIWGTSNASVWFVGDDSDGSIYNASAGALIHYNGDNSTIISRTAIGQYPQSTAITGTSDNDIFISGRDGAILHAKGGAVSSMTIVPRSPLHGVCGTSLDGLYAVGDRGAILSIDGNDWKPMASPTNNDLYAVCGTTSSMFAAGDKGTVLHYNGSNWSTVNSGVTGSLSDVWCLGANSAYVVGSGGVILNCGTGSCTPETTDGTTNNLYAVYHSGLGSFAAGKDGIFMQKDTMDNTWKKIIGTSGDIPGNDIFDLWGDAQAGILVAVGDDSYTGRSYIHRYTVTTNTWAQEYTGGNTSSQSLRAVTGTTWSDLYVVGYGSNVTGHENDGIILHRENNSFIPIKYFPSQFSAAQMVSGSLVVGASSYSQFPLYRYDGIRWTGMAGRTYLNINSIGGSSRDHLMVVGDGGLVMQFDGTKWVSLVVDDSVNEHFTSVNIADNGQWALAASYDKIFRYDGNDWSQTAIPGGTDFSDFWGTGNKVFAVGNDVILFSNNSGQNWQQEILPDTSPSLSGIWGAGPNGPFFASGSWYSSGYHATVLSRQSDGTWVAMPTLNSDYMQLGDIWGNASDNVYAVGETPSMLGENETEILHYDGASWQQVFYRHNVDPPQSFSAIIGTPKDEVFAFGSPAYHKDQCASSWASTGFPGIPSLKNVWGVEDSDGYYYLYGVGTNQMGIGDSVYRYKVSMDKKCSSPWSLFLPAILSNHE